MTNLLARDSNGHVVQALRPGTTQKVSFTAAAAATATAVPADNAVARIVATQNCHYKIDPSTAAVATDCFLPAGMVEYVRVNQGDKISFIRDSADGDAYVTFCT